MEGAPDEFVGVPGCVCHLGGVKDGAAEAVVEEQGLGEDVRGVEAADAEGDDVVEGGGGADVDEADGAGDGGHDGDCVHGDRAIGLDLYKFLKRLGGGRTFSRVWQ